MGLTDSIHHSHWSARGRDGGLARQSLLTTFGVYRLYTPLALVCEGSRWRLGTAESEPRRAAPGYRQGAGSAVEPRRPATNEGSRRFSRQARAGGAYTRGQFGSIVSPGAASRSWWRGDSGRGREETVVGVARRSRWGRECKRERRATAAGHRGSHPRRRTWRSWRGDGPGVL
jgi:hypothetical protein